MHTADQPMNFMLKNRKTHQWFIRGVFLFLLLFPAGPAGGTAETIPLHEILDRLGLRPAALELTHVKKGGSLTAIVQEPAALAELGFLSLKKEKSVYLENLGDQYWLLTDPASGRKTTFRVRRQNKPATRPRIRIQPIYQTPGRPPKNK